MKKSALISVQNKKNLDILCKIFKKYNIEIISTGGTYKKIINLGYKAKKISDITNFNEILDGRVKTLHPKIHGGILFDRNISKHKALINKNNIPVINFVIINLYAFKEAVKEKKSYDQCINNIDIGGHSLIRASAKNYKYVTIISDPEDYNNLRDELIKNNGETSLKFRKKRAAKAFELIQDYDSEISNWINNKSFYYKNDAKTILKYGENPHQKAFLYHNSNDQYPNFTKITGKEISYNNLNDVNCALNCLNDFNKPCSVIVKHENPCGVASNNNIYTAFVKSLECDPQSAYGGIVALNRSVNFKIANKINNIFLEIVIAPNFTSKAIKILKKKKLIALKISKVKEKIFFNQFKSIGEGYIEQEFDNIILNKNKMACVTKNKLSKKNISDMIFAFTVCKHVKSNAIVFAKNQQVLGIGAGQMSRIDSIKIAFSKMKKNFGKDSSYFFASDGFLPFEDNINTLKNSKCIGIIQPGGSKNDKKLIKKANSLKIPMYFTGVRHFKH